MKKITVFLFLLLVYCSNVQAFVSMDEKAIEKAQEYGIMNYQKELPDFARPWLVYEENSAALDTFSEKVYLYTPYYLVSVNARERLLASQPINTVDGKLILDAYKDSLPVCAVLYMKDTADIKTDLVGLIRQNGELLEAYAMDIQDIAVVQTMTIREEVVVDKTVENNVASQPTDNNAKAGGENKQEQTDKGKVADKEKEKENAKKDKKSKKKDNEANDDKKEVETEKPQEVTKVPEIMYIEKTVPALYRVQVFLYFDMRQINLSSKATLLIDYPKDSERRFNFSFASVN